MNQSGIPVSSELQKTYSSLSDSVFALKISIVGDELVSNGVLERGGSGDESDFAGIANLVTDKEAAYLLVRLAGETVLVNYVAEHAAVRDKMTYAATRSTLGRALKVDRSYFATLKEELTWRAFSVDATAGAGSGAGGGAKVGALSKGELELRDIKAGEQEVNNTSSRRAIASSGVGLPIEDAALEALNVLQTASATRYVSLRCDVAGERVKLDSTGDCELDDLPKKVQADGPRYLFISHSYVSDEPVDADSAHGAAKLVFCYLCPSDCKVKERMVYSSNRAAVLQASGLKVDVRYEAEELDIADLKSRIEPPKKDRVQTFSKPKRPGRK